MRLAAADEMNDLKFIAVIQSGFVPLCARQYVAVEFDGEPLRGEFELRDQRGHGRCGGDGFGFAVDGDGDGDVNRLSHSLKVSLDDEL